MGDQKLIWSVSEDGDHEPKSQKRYIDMTGNDAKVSEKLPTGLQFVNMTPASQAERQRNQKVIRSAAMKTFRRDQRLEREAKSKQVSQRKRRGAVEVRPKMKDPGQESSPSSSNSSDGGISSSDTWWQEDMLPFPSISQPSSEGDPDSKLSGSVVLLGKEKAQSASPLGSPVSVLGAGRVDPFRRYPIDITGPHVHEIMDHSVTLQWPGFMPRSQNSETTMATAWFEKATERPIVMHALLFGGAVHMDILRNPRLSIENPIRLFHKVQTMRLLKESLRNSEKIPLDDIILAVLALGTNEIETMANSSPKDTMPSPFNSPLASVQWIDVYGRISPVHAHTVAMRSLVARRGGLEKIELLGLAEILSFADILGASMGTSKPHWPLLIRPHLEWSRNDDLLSFSLGDLGQSFPALIGHGITNQTASVFQAMADLTKVINAHCRGVKVISNMPAFIHRRNAVQHRLMSLPSGNEIESGEIRSTRMYDAIRNAAMIYSAAVTFPLPPLQGIFRKLANRLRFIAEESKSDAFWPQFPKTLLWVLTLGGIAAFDTADRAWYVRNLAVVSASLNTIEWSNVVEGLKSHLWLESACDDSGRCLWVEVSRERAFLDGLEEDGNKS